MERAATSAGSRSASQSELNSFTRALLRHLRHPPLPPTSSTTSDILHYLRHPPLPPTSSTTSDIFHYLRHPPMLPTSWQKHPPSSATGRARGGRHERALRERGRRRAPVRALRPGPHGRPAAPEGPRRRASEAVRRHHSPKRRYPF